MLAGICIKEIISKGHSFSFIHDATLGDDALLCAKVKIWAAHFKLDKESLEDDDRCKRSKTARTEEHIAHVHRVVIDDRRLIMIQFVNTVGISRERIRNVEGFCKMHVASFDAKPKDDKAASVTSTPDFEAKQTTFLTVFFHSGRVLGPPLGAKERTIDDAVEST